MSTIPEGYVVCVVRKLLVHEDISSSSSLIDNPPTYVLFITAVAPPMAGMPENLLQSPQAILDRYQGSLYAQDAPRWTQWPMPLCFYQRIKAFTELFIHEAHSKLNMDQPGLSLQMVSWARCVRDAASQGTRICVQTPKTNRYFQNTPVCRKNDAYAGSLDESPTARLGAIFGGPASDDGWDVGLNIRRILDFGSPPTDCQEAQPRPEYGHEFGWFSQG